ncbi:Uncharacterised protein [uncultured archaeon]|nr:Uncharacterised protein [uncultured archaeon]
MITRKVIVGMKLSAEGETGYGATQLQQVGNQAAARIGGAAEGLVMDYRAVINGLLMMEPAKARETLKGMNLGQLCNTCEEAERMLKDASADKTVLGTLLAVLRETKELTSIKSMSGHWC